MKRMMKLIAAVSGAATAGTGSLQVFAADAAATGADNAGMSIGSLIGTLGIPVLLLVFLYIMMIRPQQKQEKQTREMQKNFQVGDEVVTIGGIVGIVLRVEEATETVVLETGSDRLKIRMKQEAIKENVTAMEQAAAEKAAKDKAKREKMAIGKPKDE